MENELDQIPRRTTTWPDWCADVLAVAELAPSFVERARGALAAVTPDLATAEALSAAYSSRTRPSARAALRLVLRTSAAGSATDRMFVANASVLIASELMVLEVREQDDEVEGLEGHGVDADQVVWSEDGPALRDSDGIMETRTVLVELVARPGVRVDVGDLAQDVIEGVPPVTFSHDVRRLWAVIEGREPPVRGATDAHSALLRELRALRSEVARQHCPYDAGRDWVEDVISSLPPLLEHGDAARALGVDPRTIRRMIARGDLTAVDVGDGGRGRSCGTRIPRGAVADFLRRRAARHKHPR